MKKKLIGLFVALMLLVLSAPSFAGGGIYTDFRVDSKVALVKLKLTFYKVVIKQGELATTDTLGVAETTLRNGKDWNPQVWITDMGKMTDDTVWKLEATNGRGKKHVYKGSLGTGVKVTCRPRHFM